MFSGQPSDMELGQNVLQKLAHEVITISEDDDEDELMSTVGASLSVLPNFRFEMAHIDEKAQKKCLDEYERQVDSSMDYLLNYESDNLTNFEGENLFADDSTSQSRIQQSNDTKYGGLGGSSPVILDISKTASDQPPHTGFVRVDELVNVNDSNSIRPFKSCLKMDSSAIDCNKNIATNPIEGEPTAGCNQCSNAVGKERRVSFVAGDTVYEIDKTTSERLCRWKSPKFPEKEGVFLKKQSSVTTPSPQKGAAATKTTSNTKARQAAKMPRGASQKSKTAPTPETKKRTQNRAIRDVTPPPPQLTITVGDNQNGILPKGTTGVNEQSVSPKRSSTRKTTRNASRRQESKVQIPSAPTAQGLLEPKIEQNRKAKEKTTLDNVSDGTSSDQKSSPQRLINLDDKLPSIIVPTKGNVVYTLVKDPAAVRKGETRKIVPLFYGSRDCVALFYENRETSSKTGASH